MFIACTTCNTKLQIDESLVEVGGSKVRCAKCNDIFMVNPTKHNTESYVQGRNRNTEITDSNIEGEVPANHPTKNIETTDDLEKVLEEGTTDYSGLPDISEIEAMVDSIWDERDHIKDISPFFLAKYSLTQDLNISCL